MAMVSVCDNGPGIPDVLLNLRIPDMDGVEIIQKIPSWSSMPIGISARTEDSHKIRASDAGADDYPTKPISVDERLTRLRVAQRRSALIKIGTAQLENGKNGRRYIQARIGIG